MKFEYGGGLERRVMTDDENKIKLYFLEGEGLHL